MTQFKIADDECDMEYDVPVNRYAGGISLSDHPSDDAKGVCLRINGQIHADLDWSVSIAQAEKLVNQGHQILWKLDLGLFDRLSMPLKDDAQMQSLKLSLQHFREAIWERFKAHTIGVQIFEDSVLFNHFQEAQLEEATPFDEWKAALNPESKNALITQAYYRRDIAAEYMTVLTASIPEGLRIFIEMDVPEEIPLSIALALLNPDRFEKIEWILKSRHPLHGSWQYHDDKLVPININQQSVGLCIPCQQWMPEQVNAVDALLRENGAVRIIAESSITSNWDQLDLLHVIEEEVTPFGRRQLQGFQAAGGIVLLI